jgi:hypothetical protein
LRNRIVVREQALKLAMLSNNPEMVALVMEKG